MRANVATKTLLILKAITLHYIPFHGLKVSQNDCRMWNMSYKYKPYVQTQWSSQTRETKNTQWLHTFEIRWQVIKNVDPSIICAFLKAWEVSNWFIKTVFVWKAQYLKCSASKPMIRYQTIMCWLLFTTYENTVSTDIALISQPYDCPYLIYPQFHSSHTWVCITRNSVQKITDFLFSSHITLVILGKKANYDIFSSLLLFLLS
jgi:hypothetical protein